MKPARYWHNPRYVNKDKVYLIMHSSLGGENSHIKKIRFSQPKQKKYIDIYVSVYVGMYKDQDFQQQFKFDGLPSYAGIHGGHA